MDNKREYKYDNLKCLMIFFVVFGHFLEILNGKFSNKIYILIYTFHMPVFAYVSGCFSKGSTKSIIKFTYIYLIWQTIFYLFDTIILKMKINYSLILPNWTLWYILAMVFWNLLIKFFNKFFVRNHLCSLIIAISISILAGLFSGIGYKLSFSRIITFFPYFLLGYISRNISIEKLKFKNNLIKAIIYSLSIISIVYFIKNINIIKAIWLYGSYPYKIAGYTATFKIMWIILSFLAIYLMYNIVPNKKIKLISNIGTNTLNIYLIHSLIIKWLKIYGVNIFCYTEIFNIVIMLILTCILLITLGSKFVTNRIVYLTDFNKVKEKFIIKKDDFEDGGKNHPNSANANK